MTKKKYEKIDSSDKLLELGSTATLAAYDGRKEAEETRSMKATEEVEYEFDHDNDDSSDSDGDDDNDDHGFGFCDAEGLCAFASNCRSQWPQIRSRWKSLAAAIIMFVLGWVFLIIGSILAAQHDWSRGSSCLIIGTLLELPGAYVCFVFCKALQKHPDFDLDMIPSYE